MLDRPDISTAAARLTPYVRRTPVLTVPGQELQLTGSVTFKLEFLQHTGSFKARGAFNRLLTAGPLTTGVVAASGGNHGAAVAYAAQALGATATIFVPASTPPTKLARIAAYGATVVRGGANYAEAFEASLRHAETTGALQVHAFDDEAVLAGAGTVGAEIAVDAPHLTHVLVAVGGGGLIGGIAHWYAGAATEVVGVEPHSCPTLHAALAAGHPTPVDVGGIAADSLGARQLGMHSFAIARQTNLQPVLVSDASIIAAQAWLWDRCRIIAEPGGATALAPLLDGTWIPPKDSAVGVVLCGANTNPGLVVQP